MFALTLSVIRCFNSRSALLRMTNNILSSHIQILNPFELELWNVPE